MALTTRTLTYCRLDCDRCHRPFGGESDCDPAELACHARSAGWRQRIDGALTPARVWLCPGCNRDVQLEQGEV